MTVLQELGPALVHGDTNEFGISTSLMPKEKAESFSANRLILLLGFKVIDDSSSSVVRTEGAGLKLGASPYGSFRLWPTAGLRSKSPLALMSSGKSSCRFIISDGSSSCSMPIEGLLDRTGGGGGYEHGTTIGFRNGPLQDP